MTRLKIKVKLTGILASSAKFREREIEMPEGTTIGEALNIIHLPVSGEWTKSSVNGSLRGKNYVLNDGDELMFFPVGGGG
ncbi:MAG: MoaD/ThiS family protein [Paludibacter sp.]|nr:MoaD/ThiS family protein [Paludibacter sp.]